ncbi:MAG: glutamate synthase-related protein, partial [Myxococcota bacterium]
HDIYSIEDLRQLIYELKQLKPNVPVVVKLVSGANIGTIAAGVVKAGADVIQISGGDGGTGAASVSSMKHAGLPWEIGMADVHNTLVDQHLREHCILRVDGGLQTGFDLLVATLLGAEEFGFGKLLLVAEGCIMARVCEKNTCPRGIATHDPKFKKKYRGSTEQVVRLLNYLAEDLRKHLATAGFSRLEEAVGRADLLEVAPDFRELVENRSIDLSGLTVARPHARGYRGSLLGEGVNRLNQRLVEDFEGVMDASESVDKSYRIQSTDRATLATLSGAIALRTHQDRRNAVRRGDRAVIESPWRPADGQARITFHGSAGQGFGAFMVGGLDVTLRGEANDSVAKSMSGGRLVIRPTDEARFAPESNAIIGNCALYGATGGTLFVNGLTGDRFAVRNSGATAVVEGAGLHACEYMTNGRVVILGRVSHNIGAGMTGGTLYLPADRDPWVNHEYLIGESLNDQDQQELRRLLEDYARATESRTAIALLKDWEQTQGAFLRYVPIKLARKQPKLRVVAEGAA